MPVDPLRDQKGSSIIFNMDGYFEFAIAIDLRGKHALI